MSKFLSVASLILTFNVTVCNSAIANASDLVLQITLRESPQIDISKLMVTYEANWDWTLNSKCGVWGYRYLTIFREWHGLHDNFQPSVSVNGDVATIVLKDSIENNGCTYEPQVISGSWLPDNFHGFGSSQGIYLPTYPVKDPGQHVWGGNIPIACTIPDKKDNELHICAANDFAMQTSHIVFATIKRN